jgi:hypothetical protein
MELKNRFMFREIDSLEKDWFEKLNVLKLNSGIDLEFPGDILFKYSLRINVVDLLL